MHLMIKSPETLLYSGDVYGFKVRAIDGELVFLNQHQDYLTLVKQGVLDILDEQLAVKERVQLTRDYVLMVENNASVLFS